MIADDKHKCLVCGEAGSFLFNDPPMNVTGEAFSIFVCDNCGLGETAPIPTDLDKYYEDYHGGRHGFTAEYRGWSRARTLDKCFDNNKSSKVVLDVGFGDGTFLKHAKQRGWDIAGTERNAQLTNDDGIEVFNDLTAVKKEFGKASFDAITCWHTLEHFADPRKLLDEIVQLLAPDGVLLVAVPNFGGLQSKVFGRNWLHLDVPRHLFHFTFESLGNLLLNHGFEVRRSWHYEFEYDIMGWSQSFLSSIFRKPGVFFNLLTGRAGGTGGLEKFANLILGTIISALALPLVLIGLLARRGGTLVICAKKIN